jgi:hypothetical protein
MKLSQNSVSTVRLSTKEGKRNGNDLKAPMNPDSPHSWRSGFCILREGRRANWNAGADPLLAGYKLWGLWVLVRETQYIVSVWLDIAIERLYYPCSKQEKSGTFRDGKAKTKTYVRRKG